MRGLVKFDISSLPPDAKIISATLRLDQRHVTSWGLDKRKFNSSRRTAQRAIGQESRRNLE